MVNMLCSVASTLKRTHMQQEGHIKVSRCVLMHMPRTTAFSHPLNLLCQISAHQQTGHQIP